MSSSLWPHGLQHARLIHPLLYPRVYSNSCPLSQSYHLTISSSITPFSCPQSFPTIGSFPRSKLFSSGGQSIGASASSISPSNENSGKPRRYSWKWESLSRAQLCDPMDYTVHGFLQSRILEWVAILFSRGSSQPRYQTQISCTASGFFTSWATKEAQEVQLVITRYSICFSTFLNIVLDLRPWKCECKWCSSLHPRRLWACVNLCLPMLQYESSLDLWDPTKENLPGLHLTVTRVRSNTLLC